MAIMSVRLSDNDKAEADNLFKNLGITTNAAINMFIKQSIRLKGLPFVPTIEEENPKLMNAINESDVIIKELKEGKRKGYNDTNSLFEALDK